MWLNRLALRLCEWTPSDNLLYQYSDPCRPDLIRSGDSGLQGSQICAFPQIFASYTARKQCQRNCVECMSIDHVLCKRLLLIIQQLHQRFLSLESIQK